MNTSFYLNRQQLEGLLAHLGATKKGAKWSCVFCGGESCVNILDGSGGGAVAHCHRKGSSQCEKSYGAYILHQSGLISGSLPNNTHAPRITAPATSDKTSKNPAGSISLGFGTSLATTTAKITRSTTSSRALGTTQTPTPLYPPRNSWAILSEERLQRCSPLKSVMEPPLNGGISPTNVGIRTPRISPLGRSWPRSVMRRGRSTARRSGATTRTGSGERPRSPQSC